MEFGKASVVELSSIPSARVTESDYDEFIDSALSHRDKAIKIPVTKGLASAAISLTNRITYRVKNEIDAGKKDYLNSLQVIRRSKEKVMYLRPKAKAE